MDDDDTDDDDINNVLDNVGKDTEAVTDTTAEKQEDESLIDEKFCCACGEKMTSETYETHCVSEHHKQNVELHEGFVIAEKQYQQGVKGLEHFLQECQDIEKRTPSLDNLISLITSALRDREQQINETKRQYNWSKGISEMGNEMNTLLKQGQMKLQEAKNRQSSDTTVSDKDDIDVTGDDSDTDLDDHDEPLPIANQKRGKGKKKREETPKKHKKRET